MHKVNDPDNDESIRSALSNMVINTTYGDGSLPRRDDLEIGAGASISLRILFEYFRPYSSEFGELTFPSFLTVVIKMSPFHILIWTLLLHGQNDERR